MSLSNAILSEVDNVELEIYDIEREKGDGIWNFRYKRRERRRWKYKSRERKIGNIKRGREGGGALPFTKA